MVYNLSIQFQKKILALIIAYTLCNVAGRAQNYSITSMLDSVNSQSLTSSIYLNDSTIYIDGGMKFFRPGFGYRLGSAFIRTDVSTGSLHLIGDLAFDSLALYIIKPNFVKSNANKYFRGGCVKSYYSDYNALFINCTDSVGTNIFTHTFKLQNVQDSTQAIANILPLNDSILICSVVSYPKAPYHLDANIFVIAFNIQTKQIEQQKLLFQQQNRFAEACALIKNKEGNIFLAGQTLKGVYAHIPDKYIVNSNVLFWELDSNLNVLNYKEYTYDTRHRLEYGGVLEVDDGYVMAGAYDVTSTTLGTPDDLIQGNLWKVSKTFSTIWETRFDTNGYFNPPLMCIRNSPDSTFVVCGWDQDPQNMATGDSVWITKGMLSKINYQGQIVWQRKWAGRYNKMTCSNFINTCEVLSNGDIVGFGSAQASQQDPNEAWVLRVGKDGCIGGACENIYLAINEASGKGASFYLFPNPVEEDLNIYFSKSNLKANYIGIITNILGQQMGRINNMEADTYYQMDIRHFPMGTYLFSVMLNDKIAKQASFFKK